MRSSRRSLSARARGTPLEHRQRGRGGAERAGHADQVARPRAVAPDQLVLVLGPADDGHRYRQRRGRARRRRRRSPCSVAARERAVRRARARARRSSAKPAGRPSARYASPGCAPIAARSDSAEASARWPTSAALAQPSLQAEVRALDHRVDGDGAHGQRSARPPRRRPVRAGCAPSCGAPASSASMDSIRERSAMGARSQRCR